MVSSSFQGLPPPPLACILPRLLPALLLDFCVYPQSGAQAGPENHYKITLRTNSMWVWLLKEMKWIAELWGRDATRPVTPHRTQGSGGWAVI